MLLADIIKFEEKMNNLVKFTVDNSVQVVTNSLIQLGDDIETETNGKGRKFVSRFIEAGIAHYNELGNILITKETLDKFLNTMVGCPVVILHKDITDENADKERVGVISDVWYNDKDGWFYCSGIIWDKKAIDLIKNQGWNVSCTYEYVSDFTPRDYNGGKIDMEFTDGKFLYLALVDNPRYTGANIVINSKDDVNNTKNNINNTVNNSNRKDNLIMAVMDELKQFIVNIVNNECDKDKKADNEKVDKRDIIRQIMAIAGKKEDDEDVRTIAKLAEKLAYDESETGTADNEDEVDKRELIREIMAIVGKYAPKEIVETVAKKAEKLGYEKSEAGTADNKCKNEDDEEDKEEYKKAKEIADNKKVNNSLSDETVKHIADMIMGGKKTDENVSLYTSQEERLKLGDNY